jgi:hypothetical protein
MTTPIGSIDYRDFIFYLSPDGVAIYAVAQDVLDHAYEYRDMGLPVHCFARNSPDGPDGYARIHERFLEKCDRLRDVEKGTYR